MYEHRDGSKEDKQASGHGDCHGGSPLRKHEGCCLLLVFAVSDVGIRRHIDDDRRLDGDLVHARRLVHRLIALPEFDGPRHHPRALFELPKDHIDGLNLRPIAGV
jgi:hypothetical protein